jgi:hypothetical protein
MCAIPSNTHSRIANLLDFSDSLRSASSNKIPPYRWAIDTRDKQAILSADTLTEWMRHVLMEINIHPPEGFAWT